MKHYPLILSVVLLSACSGPAEKPEVAPTVVTPPVVTETTESLSPSLCQTAEKTVFNCLIGSENKTVSVCAASDGSYLQYRYGLDNNNIDMVFPKTEPNSRKQFQYDAAGLSFNNGSIQYQIYTQGRSAGVKTFWAKAPQKNKDLACVGQITNKLNEL
jgi:hypothetical protein